ncbi:hypothetical protein JOC85_000883 [Bacillus mesophilus]|nr:hypothetical protein [Bacillus mesophilus]
MGPYIRKESFRNRLTLFYYGWVIVLMGALGVLFFRTRYIQMQGIVKIRHSTPRHFQYYFSMSLSL